MFPNTITQIGIYLNVSPGAGWIHAVRSSQQIYVAPPRSAALTTELLLLQLQSKQRGRGAAVTPGGRRGHRLTCTNCIMIQTWSTCPLAGVKSIKAQLKSGERAPPLPPTSHHHPRASSALQHLFTATDNQIFT